MRIQVYSLEIIGWKLKDETYTMESRMRGKKLPPALIFRCGFSEGEKRHMKRVFPLPAVEADQVLYGVVIAKKMFSLCTQTGTRSALSAPQLTCPKTDASKCLQVTASVLENIAALSFTTSARKGALFPSWLRLELGSVSHACTFHTFASISNQFILLLLSASLRLIMQIRI